MLIMLTLLESMYPSSQSCLLSSRNVFISMV